MEDHHPVAGTEAFDSLSDRDNCARSLVPEDAGRGVGAGANLLEVRSTDAAAGNPEQRFSRPDRRRRNLLDTNVVDAAVDCGLHHAGYSTAGVIGTAAGDRLGGHANPRLVFYCLILHCLKISPTAAAIAAAPVLLFLPIRASVSQYRG